MERKDWANCVRNIPFGIIPGGTGNGLAHCLDFEANLPHNALSAAILISKGFKKQLDIGAVDIYSNATPESPVKRIYSFLSLEWGFIADVDIESERLRSLGDTRYLIESIRRLLFLRKYRGRLSYLPATASEPEKVRSVRDLTGPSPRRYWDKYRNQVESMYCEAPVTTFLSPLHESVPNNWVTIEGTFLNIWNCNVVSICTNVLFCD